MALKFLPIPPCHPYPWTIGDLNGNMLPVGGIRARSKGGDTLEIGLRVEATTGRVDRTGWLYTERADAACTLPFSFTIEGRLLVGLVLEERLNIP
jgi:hypothetical protein